jgi:hypothetical protein
MDAATDAMDTATEAMDAANDATDAANRQEVYSSIGGHAAGGRLHSRTFFRSDFRRLPVDD